MKFGIWGMGFRSDSLPFPKSLKSSLEIGFQFQWSPMASKPTSCIFESLRNSQTLLENDTVSVIFSCLHMPSLTPTYRKLPFTILVFGSLLLVYFAFSLHHSWHSRDVLTQLQLWGSFCFISIYNSSYLLALLHICF